MDTAAHQEQYYLYPVSDAVRITYSAALPVPSPTNVHGGQAFFTNCDAVRITSSAALPVHSPMDPSAFVWWPSLLN